jgi:mono/diheme cytochrome c family protein
MLVWDYLYFNRGKFRPDPQKSAEWNRGAYIVEGPGHCGACHTPKTRIGGDLDDQRLQGYALQGWFAPNITNNDLNGLGTWSVAEIVEYLRTGHNATTAATGIMAEEISFSSSQWTDADLKAVAAYLKDLAPSGQASATMAPASSVMTAGGAIYRDVCSACHALDGKGSSNLFPSLAASSNVRSADPTSLIRIVLEGARSVATPKEPTAPGMPSYARQLTDAQVAAVLTYVRNAWGAKSSAVDEEVVRKQRETMASMNQ